MNVKLLKMNQDEDKKYDGKSLISDSINVNMNSVRHLVTE